MQLRAPIPSTGLGFVARLVMLMMPEPKKAKILLSNGNFKKERKEKTPSKQTIQENKTK